MSATESLCGSLNQFQKGLKWSPRMTHAVCFLSTRAIEALEQPLVPAFKHWTEIYRWNCFPTVHVRNSKPWHCGHDGLCVLLHRYVPCSCYPYPVIHMEKCKSATWKTESRHNFCISHGAGHLPRAKQLPCCDARLGSFRTSNQGLWVCCLTTILSFASKCNIYHYLKPLVVIWKLLGWQSDNPIGVVGCIPPGNPRCWTQDVLPYYTALMLDFSQPWHMNDQWPKPTHIDWPKTYPMPTTKFNKNPITTRKSHSIGSWRLERIPALAKLQTLVRLFLTGPVGSHQTNATWSFLWGSHC